MSFANRMSEELGREELRSRLGALRNALAKRDVPNARKLFEALDQDVHDFVAEDQHALLTKMLAWDDEDFALANRIHALYARMVEASRMLVGMSELRDRLDYIAAALAHWADAAKWELISMSHEPAQRFSQLHELYEEAVALEGAGHGRRMMANGSWAKIAIEPLYARALVLRRLSGGHLGPRQIEILDSWLLAWVDAMRFTADDPDPQPRLLVQTDSGAGLGLRADPECGEPIFLPLAPLKGELDRAFEFLQRGDLFPGTGPSINFRLEDHVALLDVLQREFSQAGEAPARRDARASAEGLEVDVFIGLGAILRDGFSPPSAPRMVADTGDVFEPALAKQQLRFRLRDQNDSGLGLLASRDEAASLYPGDLLGVRLESTAPCVICEVVRKVHPADDTDTLLGTRVVSRDALPLYLKRESAAAADVEALYVPGEDSSGRADSLLVSDAAFQTVGVLVKDDPEQVFRLSLNRARKRGRNWVLAGLEFLAEGQAPGKQEREPERKPPPDEGGLTLSLLD